jgi:hypothetical protein
MCFSSVCLGLIWCWTINSKQSRHIAEYSLERCSEHSISFPDWCIYCSSHGSWFYPRVWCLDGIPFSMHTSGLAGESFTSTKGVFGWHPYFATPKVWHTIIVLAIVCFIAKLVACRNH